jgi:hypothetical protein
VTGCYHLGFVVADVEQATSDLSRTVGLSWRPARSGRLGEWDYRIVFSAEGPPFFEMIQGPPGSPWDATSGPRFDHLGYWSADIAADPARLASRGAPLEFDACPYGRRFTYHRLDSIGARIELVDMAAQAAFLATWNPDAPGMSALEFPEL